MLTHLIDTIMLDEEELLLVDHFQNALNAACNNRNQALADLLEQALVIASEPAAVTTEH